MNHPSTSKGLKPSSAKIIRTATLTLSPGLSGHTLTFNLLQITSLEGELKEVTNRHKKLKAEMAQESQDPGVKLVASQVAEYKKLKNDAEKKSASLKQKLDRVCRCSTYV